MQNKQVVEVIKNNFSVIQSAMSRFNQSNVIDITPTTINIELQKADISKSIASLRENKKTYNFGIKAIDELFILFYGKDESGNDIFTTGIPQGQIILLSGMSGAGKTLTAFNLFVRLQKQKVKTAFISSDMDENLTWDYYRRALVGYHMADNEYIDAIATINYPDKPKIDIIINSGDVTVSQLDKYLTDNPQEVIFFDYIDYLQPDNKKSTPKENNKQLFLELKELRKKHNVTIILLSQASEDKGYKAGRPTLSNVYGGKEVRSAVDGVIGIYRNYNYNKKLPMNLRGVTEIIGLKLRSHARDTVAYVDVTDGQMHDIDTSKHILYEDEINKK